MWDGYVGNRGRIIAGLKDSPVRNAVVLTGNVQSHWAAEVRERFHDANSPTVATELVTTSITCGGDGCETSPEIADLLRENPHIRFSKNRRGYVRCVITPSNCAPTSGCCLMFRGPTPRCRLQHRSSWLTASRRSNGSFDA